MVDDGEGVWLGLRVIVVNSNHDVALERFAVSVEHFDRNFDDFFDEFGLGEGCPKTKQDNTKVRNI